jgi:cytochrome d ubiquinol oxidase subunit I
VAFLLAGVSAPGSWLRGNRQPTCTGALRTGLTLGAVLIPLQILAGRPARPEHAAAPAAEDRRDGRHLADRARRAAAAVRLPDEKTRSNHFEIGVPKLASLILTHDAERRNPGLDEVRRANTRRWRRCSSASA